MLSMSQTGFQRRMKSARLAQVECGSVDNIRLEADGRGSVKFTFSSARGEMSGRVNVGAEGPPDRRSTADKEQAAKNQILALARELAQICE
jgi:hypothetical protein